MQAASKVCVHTLSAFLAVSLILGRATALSTEVVGTGDPKVDVPAVQAAVDAGGEVILIGRFSFDQTPTVLTALAGVGYPPATIRISKSVSILGLAGDGDEMARIDGGTIPFYVDAPGATVSIRKMRFVNPNTEAVLVYAGHGVTIADCKIDGVVPGSFSIAIDIDTVGNPPTPTQPGNPANISGRVLVDHNDIDVSGGSSVINTLGITVFSVGQSPDTEADIFITRNKIRNVTEPAINFRRLGGRALIEGNVITTGNVSSTVAAVPDVIRVANTGSYVITHNRIFCEWPDPQAIGIGVFSQFKAWPLEHAVVTENEISLSPPIEVVFGALSAGIDVRGFTQDNIVANNRIEGRGRAAIAIDPFKGGTPANNALISNRFKDFEPSQADVFVGANVTDTLILGVGQNNVEDHGVSTVIVPPK